MSNFASTSSSSSTSSLDHQTAYISTALASGTYKQIPTYLPPSPLEVRHVRRLWDETWRRYAGDVVAFFGRRRGRGEVGDMKRVLDGLKGFCLPLELDPSVNVPISTLQSLLPDLSRQISSLLASPPFQPFGKEDATVLGLCQWFKSSFMRWIDPIPCPICGGSTHSEGSASPTTEEREDGAGRVELHKCNDTSCGAVRRFGRYGKVGTLIRTREGRCGEWAHLFYVLLRARGIDARYIWNSEATINKPLLYARGWGKKQAFCLAFGPYGAEDVTRAYVDDFDGACRGRRRARGWKEGQLRKALYACTVSIRLRLSPSERSRLEAMDQSQSMWIADEVGRLKEAEREDLGGRVSGPEDWRAMRDEMGLGGEIKKPKYKVIRQVEMKNETLSIFGDARIEGATILLTSASDQTSAVFHPHQISKTGNYRVNVQFRLTSPPGAGEADGMAVVFTSGRGLGLGGYGLGYTGLGAEGDFAVEVDTYRSQDTASDPPTPHVSVHSPPNAHHSHSIGCTAANSIPFLSDGRIYDLELIYEGRGGSRRLQGYLGLPSDNGKELELVDVKIPEGGARNEWFVGVTGSCGGLWQKQEIVSWTIEEIDFLLEDETESSTNEVEDIEKETDDL
nr:uncharacterized protein CI109_001446 [Kwoniella shandongensis]KAA5530043.1 hypothetical protein CI109_001446 [Kwoniella shandongensis]